MSIGWFTPLPIMNFDPESANWFWKWYLTMGVLFDPMSSISFLWVVVVPNSHNAEYSQYN